MCPAPQLICYNSICVFLIFYTGWNRMVSWCKGIVLLALCRMFLFPIKMTEVKKKKWSSKTREPIIDIYYTEMWRPYALKEKVFCSEYRFKLKTSSLRYNIKINTDQELQERTQFNVYSPSPQSSWYFPQENLVSIRAELFKWKGKLSQVDTIHGLLFVLSENHMETLLRLTFRIHFTLKFVSLLT